MSKIGRKYIPVAGVAVEIKPDGVHYRGKHASGVYELPAIFEVSLEEGNSALFLRPKEGMKDLAAQTKELWGLHRALLNSTIYGAHTLFEKSLEIRGVGYKAMLQGSQLELTLGFSHKKQLQVPQGVSVTIDKSGQKVALFSANKELLGHFASQIRSCRKPEPYKGTGIEYAGVTIRRKEGKTS